MTSNTDRAAACFSKGFNCAQSVFSAFAPSIGLDEQTALKIASGFGAGMAGMQHVCGAVTGAYMAIGYKYGKFREGDDEAKERTYTLMQSFTEKFKEHHDSIICRDLLGCDLSTEEGKAEAREKNLFDTLCAKLVGDAAEILEDLM